MTYVTEGKSVINAAQLVRREITYRVLTQLKPFARNPRVHKKKQVEEIARSIQTFGFLVPILTDGEGNVIAGHGRLLAAKLLQMTEVPVICISDLTEAQIQAFRIADNKLCENSTWNERLLAETFKELSELTLDFTLDTTGFSVGEIDVQIQGLSLIKPDEDPADDLPPGNPIRVAKVGDLWLLGEHRVLCGDARLAESFSKLMNGQLAVMVLTDPPYNLVIDGFCTGKGITKHSEFLVASGEMTPAEYCNFLQLVFRLMAAVLVDGGLVYVFIDYRHVDQMISAGKSVFSTFKNLAVWAKDRAGMGSFYRSQHELCCIFKFGNAPHQNHFQLGQHGRYRSNLWSYPCPVSFGTSRDEGEILRLHPTIKPSGLIADAIMDVTRRGEIVLDPFLGSGTTVVAAERTGRTCFAMELDPQYVDLSIRRWQAFTGQNALHAASGRSFNELEKEMTDVAE